MQTAERQLHFSSPTFLPPPPPQKSLRPYQQQAIQATLEALAQGKNPVVSIPTGGGKSLIIAALTQAIHGRILVATHRKELLLQNSEELSGLADDDIGIYSAGLSRREASARVVFGGIQSIYRRMEKLQRAGNFTAVIVDEAHLCAPSSQDSTMYAQVFAACPEARRIGLSATPFRLNDGPIWGNNSDTFFDTLAHEVSIQSLTPEYLSPLRGILTAHDIDLTGVRKIAREYVLSDMSQVACKDSVVDGALDELCSLARNRQHWLVFCVDVAHTELVTQKLRGRGIAADMIVGATDSDIRGDVLDRFKHGELRALVNCLVSTTGFNLPTVDVVAMLRPTLSKSLVIQCIGRGSRKAPGKEDCCVIDFAGNIERHQPLDGVLATCDKSPARQAKDEAEEKKRSCYARRREREIKHGDRASTADPFGVDQASSPRMTQRVLGVTYACEPSKKHPGRQNIVITYRLAGEPRWARTWLCPEYPGWAGWHAEQFFKRKGLPAPVSARDGVEMLREVAKPVSVVVDRSEKYPRIVMEHFDY